MKRIFYVLIGLVLSGAVSSAELIPGKNIRILVINEQEPESWSGPFELKDGFTQVVVRVSARLGKGSSKKVFDSAPFIMMFESNGQDLEIIAPQMNNYEWATRHFEGVPKMKLVDSNGDVEYTYQKLEGKDGFMPYQDVQELVVEHNQNNAIFFGSEAEITAKAELAAVAATTVAAGSSAGHDSASKGNLPNDGVNLDQLKAWYLKASKAERKEFRRWMIDQE
ncbi:DUF2057 domain-containing protein [Vibrio sp. DW001]|uniref:DUF2057 family protein n=1 Tax=Vibrio sp. DW001 TaxID=2912315 RepID=UPI0023AFD770|nr:DUF2057 family protein [Vibrio sp. DW001]WED25582.1 DUF2057 domain-containing protein [Vibrio sp. DW001]